jgi:hypothetical protein
VASKGIQGTWGTVAPLPLRERVARPQAETGEGTDSPYCASVSRATGTR